MAHIQGKTWKTAKGGVLKSSNLDDYDIGVAWKESKPNVKRKSLLEVRHY